ncbi:MAG: MGMT family protein [Candidatus Campbellbacteria bacterium]|nr:MGMT family protein [Candidatus Campbellbacteria bacterium]
MKKKVLGPTFSERVVRLAQKIPSGRVTTYGRIARSAGGGAMSAQSITSILGKAEGEGASIPFHRIVYADGRIWINEQYRAQRMKLYKQEGIEIEKNDRIKYFWDVLYEF